MRGELLSGDGAARALTDACENVRSRLSYLCGEVGERAAYVAPGPEPRDDEWIRCADLAADPEGLAALVRATGRSLGTEDPVVAASLFVQNYAYRVLTQAVACATTSAVIPDSRASAMAFTVARGRPAKVAYAKPVALTVGEEFLGPSSGPADEAARRAGVDFILRGAVEEHLRALIEATRQRVRVGERLLWGNVAASGAVAFRTMEGLSGPWVRSIAELFFQRAPTSLQGLGAFYSLEVRGRRGWFWERTNCCLHDHLPEAIRCGDCSLTPVDLRRAAYRDGLASS